MTDLSLEAQTAIRQIEKLLRLAAKHPTEAEGILAANKAQELLTKHNLDMATVERGSDSGRREDAKMRGGLYHYQRDLWEAVAELNFCLYWNQYVYDQNKVGRRKATWRDEYRSEYEDKNGELRRSVQEGQTIRVKGGYRFVHRVVGRMVNVAATRVMAEYLEQAVERLTRERLDNDGSQFFTAWAISYREGIAERIVDKIYERRKAQLRAELRKQKEEQKRAADAAAAPFSTSTAVTLSSYSQSEHDANMDHVKGEGWSARRAMERAEAAREEAEQEAEYVAWAKAHPEEAAAKAKAEREARAKRRVSYGARDYKDRKLDKRDWGAWRAGQAAGNDVSIEQQADDRRARRAIG